MFSPAGQRCLEDASKLQTHFSPSLEISLSYTVLSKIQTPKTAVLSSSFLNHLVSKYLRSAMLLNQLLLPVLLAASTNAQRSAGPRFCGTPSPTEEQTEASKLLLELERSSMRPKAPREIKVNTYFHVLAKSER
jgi:hypothetical protein